MAQALATFTATMPATFPAILAEHHARRSIHQRPPRPHHRSRPPPDKATGEQGRRQAHRASGKWSGGCIGIAPNIKTPCRRVKMANRAYSRKAPGIHREQKKTPHSVSHAGHGYFWSFARSSSSKIGCNRIYNKIKGGTSLHLDCTTSAGAGQAKVKRRAIGPGRPAILNYFLSIQFTDRDTAGCSTGCCNSRGAAHTAAPCGCHRQPVPAARRGLPGG